MKKITLLSIIFCFISCTDMSNCDSIKIDENIDSLHYSFKSPIKNPFKMDCEMKWKFNDSIIINGEYISPKDTIIKCTPSDFYSNEAAIKFSYYRYKATKVEIEYSYCFY